MDQGAKYRAPALQKGLSILETLAQAAGPMNMSDISTALSRSRNEIFRMLQVLEEMHYISRDAGGGYSLTNRLFALGMQQPPIRDMLSLSLPVMHELAEEAGQSCHLAVASWNEMVVVARMEAPGLLGFAVRVGHRRPLHLSASGRTLLAFQPERVQAQMLAEIEQTDAAVDLAALRDSLRAIDAQGHFRQPSLMIPAIIDISAPILVQKHAVAALTVPFMQSMGARTTADATVDLLCRAAKAISDAVEGTRIQ